MSLLEVRGLAARVDGEPFLRDLSFTVPSGRIHVLLGPSGCGKSTLLKTLAGLHPTERGEILVDGVDVTRREPERRGLVLLHQENTLFPHLTVEENVRFGLRLRGVPPAEAAAKVDGLLRLVNLEGFGPRRIEGLSGGERQRVALARALAVEPRVILLDEPFSALDRLLRQGLREDLGRILRSRGATALYVTHDQEEAFALGNDLLVMDAGRIIDRGPVATVFRRPASPASAAVLGRRNVYGAERPRSFPGPSEVGALLVLEESLDLAKDDAGGATVRSAQFLGVWTQYVVDDGVPVVVDRPGLPVAAPGDRVGLDWGRAEVHRWGGAETHHP